MTASQRAQEFAIAAAQAAADKLATDIVAIDVSSHLALSDVFVVCSASNERQVKAIVDNVEDRLLELGEKFLHREGERDGHWVLLDYPEIVVHVQLEQTRAFYRLEKLWNDCPALPLPMLAGDRS
ncbi:MAG: ribosome silencing factor [Candidatus Nanopelagicales bacterium]